MSGLWCTHTSRICCGFRCVPKIEGCNDVFSAIISRWPVAHSRTLYALACVVGAFRMLRKSQLSLDQLKCSVIRWSDSQISDRRRCIRQVVEQDEDPKDAAYAQQRAQRYHRLLAVSYKQGVGNLHSNRPLARLFGL